MKMQATTNIWVDQAVQVKAQVIDGIKLGSPGFNPRHPRGHTLAGLSDCALVLSSHKESSRHDLAFPLTHQPSACTGPNLGPHAAEAITVTGISSHGMQCGFLRWLHHSRDHSSSLVASYDILGRWQWCYSLLPMNGPQTPHGRTPTVKPCYSFLDQKRPTIIAKNG